MPKEYEAIRDSLKKQGKSDKEAERIAAATYNKRHPGDPMGPHNESRDLNDAQRLLKTLKESEGVSLKTAWEAVNDLWSGDILQIAIRCVREIGGGRSSYDSTRLADVEKTLVAISKK